eukprot:342420-Amphidinium_carterae.1
MSYRWGWIVKSIVHNIQLMLETDSIQNFSLLGRVGDVHCGFHRKCQGKMSCLGLGDCLSFDAAASLTCMH